MGRPRKTQEPDAGIGLFRNWTDEDSNVPALPDAGIGLFSDYAEHEPNLPDAGIGIFDHWLED